MLAILVLNIILVLSISSVSNGFAHISFFPIRGSLSLLSNIDVNFVPESKRRFQELSERIDTILTHSVLEEHKLRQIVLDLETECSQNDFWSDNIRAQLTLTELGKAKSMIERISRWSRLREDAKVLIDIISNDSAETGS